MPKRMAMQQARYSIRFPHDTGIPASSVANRMQYLWQGDGRRIGFRQQSGYLVMRCQSVFRFLTEFPRAPLKESEGGKKDQADRIEEQCSEKYFLLLRAENIRRNEGDNFPLVRSHGTLLRTSLHYFLVNVPVRVA